MLVPTRVRLSYVSELRSSDKALIDCYRARSHRIAVSAYKQVYLN
jgi:hypothetical protein